MSWSVTAIGKPTAVASHITASLSEFKCVEPEEGVKQSAIVSIAAALLAQDPRIAVRVEASGHQSDNYVLGKKVGVCNTMSIKIEPISGFLG